MTAAIRRMCEYAFAPWPITSVFVRPFATNACSLRLLEKAGFTLGALFSGTLFKRWELVDELIYGLRRPVAGARV
jgi:RimJ/RimL family protein N-acetyltransferase